MNYKKTKKSNSHFKHWIKFYTENVKKCVLIVKQNEGDDNENKDLKTIY